MKKAICTFLFIMLLSVPAYPEEPQQTGLSRSINGKRLLAALQEKLPERAKYITDAGAEIRFTEDKQSFFIIWYPDKAAVEKPVVIASLHGRMGNAFDDFYNWHQALKDKGYGIIVLQWWLGGADDPKDYLRPGEMYRAFDQVFRAEGIKTGKVILHGFSWGSSNIFPVTSFDVLSNNRYFSVIIANSGGAELHFAPTAAITKGGFGDKPFNGTKWIMFASGRDPNPDREGIPAMQRSKEWVTKYGGEVIKVFEDPYGEHGSLFSNLENLKKILKLLT